MPSLLKFGLGLLLILAALALGLLAWAVDQLVGQDALNHFGQELRS